MQFIEKLNTPPPQWESWFTTAVGRRSYDYHEDFDNLPGLKEARQYLIDEQHGLCAYCQRPIKLSNSSIEHIIPKQLNKYLSTAYHNLVAVCRDQQKDQNDRYHCDMEKSNRVIIPVILMSNSSTSETKNNSYFRAYAEGTICPHPSLKKEEKEQINAFIEILNLNHQTLVNNRKREYIDGILMGAKGIPKDELKTYWKAQYKKIFHQKDYPFRQFLLIYCASKIGLQ